METQAETVQTHARKIDAKAEQMEVTRDQIKDFVLSKFATMDYVKGVVFAL